MSRLILIAICLSWLVQCADRRPVTTPEEPPKLEVGAVQFDRYLPLLEGKRVALVVNHTSLAGDVHLADTLKSRGVNLVKIFAPEHGFRGTADPGEHIEDGVDRKLGLPVVSLYGNNRKPTSEQLTDVDVAVFDIQDVGTRFYTYISTLHYVMEACAENGKKVIVLDRPNPNSYVDGPVLDTAFRSFVGMHPIPVVHGLTVGELARMINGEGWLAGGRTCELEVIPVNGWSRNDFYSCPVRPSPNLPNDQAIRLYPSLCFFEGTVISVGRGTQTPFQVIGNPLLVGMEYHFTPVSIEGMMKNPPFENQVCYGLDLRNVPVERRLNLQYVIDMYKAYPDKENFFTRYFNTLAGTDQLRKQIEDGLSEAEIRESWKEGLERYVEMREKYLIYQ
ncbi:MAG: DUF1343 domain-containing protein [Bacteroidota bacterium]|jgi:uncharacterized protein YbbC (DUF1343 family)|nr:MAG: DUF1343 domain-containing protein [Bacteroidota bacterium]